MYKLAAISLLTLGLAACTSNGGGNDPDPDNPGVGGNEGDLPDAFADLAYDSQCDGATDSDGNFQGVSGAATYWVGEFELLDGGDVRGTETLVVYANETWEENDPDVAMDCEIVFSITGQLDFENKCALCDYALSYNASLNETETTCDITFAKSGYAETYSDTYDVELTCPDNGACDARFSFQESGNELATGKAAGNFLQYNAPLRCAFY